MILFQDKDAQIAIRWSEALDEIFRQNYKSDPALSWQYFGSSFGIMRHYPGMFTTPSNYCVKELFQFIQAMRWKVHQDEGSLNDGRADTFDCRVRTWFIEATTCTKDVVILLDNSGSMQGRYTRIEMIDVNKQPQYLFIYLFKCTHFSGMGKHIASFTVSSILQTLSNNDYLNILSYNNTVKFIVPCFENRLVQATKENIEVFMDTVTKLQPDEKSNLVGALEKAFELLANVRNRNRNRNFI